MRVRVCVCARARVRVCVRARACACVSSHSISHSKQKMYVVICPIPNGFQSRAISLYSSLGLASNVVLPFCHIAPKCQLAVVTFDRDIVGVL
jgi:hypothetical protein